MANVFRHRQYQSQSEVRLAELQSEVKLKSFELDRLQLLYDENLKSLKNVEIENEKLQKKNQVCLDFRTNRQKEKTEWPISVNSAGIFVAAN